MSVNPQLLHPAPLPEPGFAPCKLDELLTADEVAKLLQLPRSTVSDYARRGVLPSIKLGRHRRFVRSDVVNAIERLRQQPRPPIGPRAERSGEPSRRPGPVARST